MLKYKNIITTENVILYSIRVWNSVNFYFDCYIISWLGLIMTSVFKCIILNGMQESLDLMLDVII